MPSDRVGARLVSHTIHWLLILTTLVLLGSGWAIQNLQLPEPDKHFWQETHNSLGITCALLLLLYVVSAAIPHRSIDDVSPWRRRMASTVTVLLCLTLAVQIASGYLDIAPGGGPISFWGLPLPEWGPADLVFPSPFRDIHQIFAFVTAGLILLHVALSGMNRFARRTEAIPEPALLQSEEQPSPEQEPKSLVEPSKEQEPQAVVEASEAEARQLAIVEKQNLVVIKTANNLAQNLRLFGWIDFWLQFVLDLVIALLLVFASSGKAFSPSRAGFGDAIYWGWTGLMLLIPAILLAFYYIRSSKKVALSPIAYLHHEKRLAFWFLWTGLVIGGLGIFVSFIGVAMSIVLLVVKTISQPPGIAITDPNNIIRALDVFVLIVNFLSLIAHFVGVLTALWLGYCASAARVGYMSIRSHAP
jgi:cytochrome b561